MNHYIHKLLQGLVVILVLTLLFKPSQIAAEGIYTTEKLITVDTAKQMLYAWEGGQIVYQSPVSTGLPKSPTVKGTFRIYLKYENQAQMRGWSPYVGWYNYKNVPHVMYFYRGYGIHGAYWHNNFGTRRSNGCVNVPLYAAAWLFDFAPHGTKVVIF